MADEASKPQPSLLYGWWSIAKISAHAKGGKMHFAKDEMIFVWPDGTWEATASKTTQNGDDVTIEGRSVFSDTGPVHAKIHKRVQLVADEFAAVVADASEADELDKQATSKLPAEDICVRAIACAKEAATIKQKLELHYDPVTSLDGAGRTLCDAQLKGNAAMYERKTLPIPAACK